MVDLSRRDFMLAGTTSLLAMPGSVQAQLDPAETDADTVRGVADLLGPRAARPEPGDPFFEDKIAYAYRYEATDTRERFYITDDDTEWRDITMSNPQTQVGEVRTEDHTSFFNHTFSRPEAPDDKNWEYTDADVSKLNSEVQLASSTVLESTQRGNYPPGTEAIPGVAFRVDATPTGGRGQAGYFNDGDGFGVGEDSTDSFVFIRKAGATERVYRSNWNGHVPGGRVWASDSPVITRFPHLFYGGGSIKIRALLHEAGETTLRTLHTFTPENVPDSFGAGPPFDQPNLPIRFESASLSGASLLANAAHYEFGEQFAETRTNGEHFTEVSVGATGWTPLLSWEKRTGWDMVNVQPLKISVLSDADLLLDLQLGSTLSGANFTLPTNTASDETAVEVDTAGTLDVTGERRWLGVAGGGQGNKTGSQVQSELNFNLPTDKTVTLAAQSISGSATVTGAVGWEEFF